jgi:hypothetical protein
MERMIRIISQLPDEKAEKISDFADFVLKRYEEQLLTSGIQQLVADSRAFDFWDKEEDIYTVSDLKEVYNG